MATTPCDSLLAAFARLTDPRHRRGIRHPFAALLALTFLGLLCRQADFAAIARWARAHWAELRGPLGFTRDYAPHATTLSRAAACFRVDEFRAALAGWLSGALGGGDLAAAVDGKTSKQALGDDGPVHVLNIFLHGAKLCLADWPVGGAKATEPEVLKTHLDELFAAYPALRVLTGDALFCQRPLAEAIVGAGREYVLAVKENQPELREATRTAFATVGEPAALTREKSAGRW